MKESLYLVFCLVVCVPAVLGYGSGAPTTACVTMQPGHMKNGQGLSPQTGTSPYTIEVVGAPTSFTEGTPVKVKIGGSQYTGFLLQVRKDGTTTAVGTWNEVTSIAKVITCSSQGSTLTHTNTNTKTPTQEYVWNPPSGAQGSYKIIATVATDHDNYWVGLQSSALTATSGGGTASKTGVTTICFIVVAMVTLLLV